MSCLQFSYIQNSFSTIDLDTISYDQPNILKSSFRGWVSFMGYILRSLGEVQLIKHNLALCTVNKWNSFLLGVSGLKGFPRDVKFMGDQGGPGIYVDMGCLLVLICCRELHLCVSRLVSLTLKNNRSFV